MILLDLVLFRLMRVSSDEEIFDEGLGYAKSGYGRSPKGFEGQVVAVEISRLNAGIVFWL